MKLFAKLFPFVIPLVILLYLDTEYLEVIGMTDILMGTIAFSSSSVGFFIAGVSLLQTSSISRFYKKLVELGTNKKIISWLMTAIVYLFILSVLSIVNLYLFSNIEGGIVNLFFDLWLSFLIASILSSMYIILIFAILFNK